MAALAVASRCRSGARSLMAVARASCQIPQLGRCGGDVAEMGCGAGHGNCLRRGLSLWQQALHTPQKDIHSSSECHQNSSSAPGTSATEVSSQLWVGENGGPAENPAVEVGGSWFRIHSGTLHGLADGAVVVEQAGAQVMAAVVVDPNYNISRLGYILDIGYKERACAHGRIPSTFHKREGAPREGEVLVMSLLEQVIRPLLPSGYTHDTRLDCMMLAAAGGEANQAVLAINAASAAVACSGIPWGGPVGAVQVAVIDGNPVVSPTRIEREAADAILMYVGTEDCTVLVTGEGLEALPNHVLSALEAAHKAVGPIIAAQREASLRWPQEMRNLRLVSADPSATTTIESVVKQKVEELVRDPTLGAIRTTRRLRQTMQDLRTWLVEKGYFRIDNIRIAGSGTASPNDIELGFRDITIRAMKRLLREEGLRGDGRGARDSNGHDVYVEVLPGVHGSSLIRVGEGQVLATATVGGQEEWANVDSPGGKKKEKKQLITQFGMGMPLERTWGGGGISRTRRQESFNAHLLGLALRPILPDAFPFAVRLNVELLGVVEVPPLTALYGSSCALSSCIPLARPVAGVSVGIVDFAGEDTCDLQEDPERFEFLADVSGLEEDLVELEVQLAGTERGVTALHAACQTRGVPLEVFLKAFRFATVHHRNSLARLEGIARKQGPSKASFPVWGNSNKMAKMEIPAQYIGRVIGSQGSTIKRIEEECGGTLVLEDNGTLHIFAPTDEQLQGAILAVKNCMPASLTPGQVYRVKVKTIKDFGAIVEFPGKMEGLLHISEVALERVRNVADVMKVGDEIDILFSGTDKRGSPMISRKALLERKQTPESGHTDR